jgi:hypothetical protein
MSRIFHLLGLAIIFVDGDGRRWLLAYSIKETIMLCTTYDWDDLSFLEKKVFSG